MLRVEFTGIPGVGKTTVQNALVKQLQVADKNKYMTAQEAFLKISRLKIDKIFRLILNVLPDNVALNLSNKLMNRSLMQFHAQNRFLSKWGKSFEAFLSSNECFNLSTEDRENVIGAFIKTGSIYECINKPLPEHSVVFFEEGFVQKSFMFISNLTQKDTDKKHVFRYLTHIPLPDLIIYIKADPDICLRRMIARPSGLTNRLRKHENNAINKFLETADEHLKIVLAWLIKNKSLNIIEIENQKSIVDTITILKSRIKSNFDEYKIF